VGDPVKFEISGFPKDFGTTTKRYIYDAYHPDQYLAEVFDNYLKTKSRDITIFWGGDIINPIVSYLQSMGDDSDLQSLRNKACYSHPECKEVNEILITMANRDN